MKSIEVFISYHQKDEELREELENHLATLLREQTITSWHNREIVAGQEFQAEINKYLKRAGLILLLVSPDFIASDYHWTVEVTRALEQNAAGKARVIPVLLRHADWETPPINELSPLPSNRKPIKSWSDRDEAFLEVVKGIRQEVARLVANANSSPTKQTTQELEEREYQVTTLLNEAARLREAKKFEEATLKYKAALSLDPNSVYAHTALGFVLAKLGRLEEAIASYQTALRLDPNYAIAHNNLGSVLEDQGKLEQAIASYQTALRLDPSNTSVHNNLGSALYNQGKLEQAIASYQTALRLDPNYANAHNNLGFALYNQGKLEAAIASYQTALRLDPNHAFAHNNLGSALYSQGKLEAAIAELEIAVHLEPTNTLFRQNLETIRNKNKGFWGRLFS